MVEQFGGKELDPDHGPAAVAAGSGGCRRTWHCVDKCVQPYDEEFAGHVAGIFEHGDVAVAGEWLRGEWDYLATVGWAGGNGGGWVGQSLDDRLGARQQW